MNGVRIFVVQSSDHYGEHGGDGEPAVGVVVTHEESSVPQQQRVAAEDGEVGCAQSQALGESAPVAKLLSHSQGSGVGLENSGLPDEGLHRSDLRQRLKSTKELGVA